MADATNTQISIPADDWITAVSIAVVAGFVGGVGAAIQDRLEKTRRGSAELSGSDIRTTCVIAGNGIVGSVAALGGLFIVLLSPVTASLRGGAFWAFLAGSSALFGLFGRRILPAIEQNFSRRLGFVERKLGEVEDEFASKMSEVDVLRFLEDARNVNAVPSKIERAIEIGEAFIESNPRAKYPHLRLTDLVFEKKADRPRGIAILTKYIDFMKGAPASSRDRFHERDLVDALYNRCCCWVLAGGPPEVAREYIPNETEVANSIKDLREAFGLMPGETKADAIVDVDLAWLRDNSSEFRVLFG